MRPLVKFRFETLDKHGTMKKSRRKFSSAFKAEVAIEALKERETMSELSKRYGIHAQQIGKWKSEFLENSALVFENGSIQQDEEAEKQRLYAKIGQLEMERDWLKKKSKQLGLPTNYGQ